MRKRKVVSASIVILLALLTYGWSVIRRGFSAHDEPSAVEAFMARTAWSLAVPASYNNLKNLYPSTPENLREGLEHFADHCAVCHANNGSGDSAPERGGRSLRSRIFLMVVQLGSHLVTTASLRNVPTL